MTKMNEFAVTAKGKTQGQQFARLLATLLFDEKTYMGAAKGCIFRPGVAFRVWKGNEFINVLICYSCREIKLFKTDQQQERNAETDIWFDSAQSEFIMLAQEAFPDDQEIQALREKQIQ